MQSKTKSLAQIFDNCRKLDFFNVGIVDNLIQNIECLALGEKLCDNIAHEWSESDKNANQIWCNAKKKAFEASKGTVEEHFAKPLEYILDMRIQRRLADAKNEVPFVLLDCLNFNSENKDSRSTSNSKEIDVALAKGRVLTASYFVNDSLGKEIFYQIQRQRKIWWMKFSSHPGRFYITDPTTEMIAGTKIETVQLKSKFGENNIGVEQIQLFSLDKLAPVESKSYLFRDARLEREIVPAVIKCSFCLEQAGLATLLDAQDTVEDHTLYIHRSIAPYQCSVFLKCSSQANPDETHKFLKLIENLLATAGITLKSSQNCEHFVEMDKIGVPFCLILSETSLQNGLILLRNRDTTLSEVIHISDVPDYLVKILNA